MVYEAYDRRVGRSVALKRLLGDDARSDAVPARVVEARFFAEAKTLARVRSPHVVALLDVQPYAAVMDDGGFHGLVTRADVLNYLRRQMAGAPAS